MPELRPAVEPRKITGISTTKYLWTPEGLGNVDVFHIGLSSMMEYFSISKSLDLGICSDINNHEMYCYTRKLQISYVGTSQLYST
jgi:hypothetical protein